MRYPDAIMKVLVPLAKRYKACGATAENRAYLSGANLTGSDVNLQELKEAYLVGAVMPDGNVHE